MNPKNIVRLKIIYCIFWLTYPFWLCLLTQGVLWGGFAVLGFLSGHGRVAAAIFSGILFIANTVIGFFIPACKIVDNSIFYGGPTWSRLIEEMQELHKLELCEIEEAQKKRLAEIDEAVRLAREVRS